MNRSVQRSLASIVLGFESLIVLLGALVMFGLRRLDPALALVGGGVLFVVMIVTIGLLKYRWAFVLGWLVQAVVLVSGFFEPAMFIVGAIFGAMWVYCMITGSRIDRANRENYARENIAAAHENRTQSEGNPE